MADRYEESMREWFKQALVRAGTLRVAAVTPKEPPQAVTPDEEAFVKLLFEEDDALMKRVSETITALFFGAKSVYGDWPKQNCDALFRQMVKNATVTDEFRVLVAKTFRGTIEASIDRIVREELESLIAKRLAGMDKYSRRISAAPKGPRK